MHGPESRNAVLAICAAGILMVWPFAAESMESTFSFQGVLNSGGAPADGAFDFRFELYDSEVGGSQVGSTLYRDDVTVESGLFTEYLDFGQAPFTGGGRWIEVAVRPGGTMDPYTSLAPRQAILPSPYALRSARIELGSVGSGEVADNSLTAADLATNSVGSAELAPNSVTGDHILNGTITSSDINAGSVQRRVSDSCLAGYNSISSIDEDGTVTCEYDYFTYVASSGPYATSSYNGNDTYYTWPKPSGSSSLCFLTKVQLRDVDGSSEDARCYIEDLTTSWRLVADTETGDDADAMCEMRCIYWRVEFREPPV